MSTVWKYLVYFALICHSSAFNGGPFCTQQRIVSNGYPLEEHVAFTSDGWQISLQRIPHGRKTPSNGRICLLQHGFIDSSAGWLLNTPQESLGFILADAGCDVWLANSRGNSYSNTSLKYNPDQAEYWQFSFDDFAMYDLPAQVNYILKTANAKSLAYVNIGVSQGTAMAFAALSNQSELNTQIDTFIALAPIAFLNHVESPLLQFLASLDMEELLILLDFHKFYPNSETLQEMVPELCQFTWLCDDIFALIYGDSPKTNHTPAAEEIYMSNEPDWTSVKEAVHFAQEIKSGKFQMFDYGTAGNIKVYNSSTPPQYNVSQINTSIALFYGEDDQLADITDVKHLMSLLKPSCIIHAEEIPNYFNWAITAYKVLYPQVVKVIFNNETYDVK